MGNDEYITVLQNVVVIDIYADQCSTVVLTKDHWYSTAEYTACTCFTLT